MNESDTTMTDVQTVVGKGRPAKERIATADAAIAIYQRMKTDDEDDAKRRAAIQGMIDGNPPQDQTVLDELGLGDVTNVNFGGMAAKLRQRAAAAHELFYEVPTLIELELQVPDPQDRISDDWGSVISEEFTKLIMDEPGFLITQDLMFRDSDATGIGYCTFPDEYDFIPVAHRRGTLYFDSQASVNVDENQVFIIRDKMCAGELFTLIDQGEQAEAAGWNLSALRRTLVSVFTEGNNGPAYETYQTSRWEELQSMYRNNETTYQSKQFQPVRILRYLVREVSGDQLISNMILAEADLVVGNTAPKSPNAPKQEPVVAEFLFKAKTPYDKMSQAIWWLPFEYGDGTARSVRGIASSMFKHEDLSNRFLGSIFDSAFLRGSFVLQSATQIDLGKLQLTRHGPMTVLPAGLQTVQSTFQPDVSTAVEIRKLSESIMENNTGLTHRYAESLSADTDTRKTARQVVEESSKEAKMEKAQVAHRYNQYERLYREMFRRLTRKEYLDSAIKEDLPRYEAAKEFVDRCKKRGVPLEYIKDGHEKWRVTATRAIGLGSLGVKMDIANQFMAKYPMLSDRGRHNAKRFWAATLVGQKNVNMFVEPLQLTNVPTQEMSFAVVEDGLLADGKQTLATGDQMHEIHIQSHGRNIVMPIVQSIQQKQQIPDPMKAFSALRAALQHIAAHLQYWQGNPGMKDKIAEIQKLMQAGQAALTVLNQMVQEIQRQRQKQQEDAQKQQMEMQRRMANAENEKAHLEREDALEAFKQQSLNQMRAQKTAEQTRIHAVGAQHEMDLQANRMAHELQMNALKTQADIELKRAKAAGKEE